MRSNALLPSARLLLALWAVALAVPTWAAPPRVQPDDVVLEDQLAIEVIGRDVYGFDGQGAGGNHLRLELGEIVQSTASRGWMGLVLTDRRALALASGAGYWRELPLRVGEWVEARSWLSPRVLVIATSQRILGFDSSRALWLEIDVGPQEAVTHVELGASTAVVVTDRHAYGLAPEAGGFYRESIRLHERLERVSASATLGQIRTNQRILVFRATNGVWTVEQRPIN